MKMLGKIGYRDGWMCAVVTDPMFNEPKRVTTWFPIERCDDYGRKLVDLDGNECQMDGMGRVAFKMGYPPMWVERTLPDGGRTKAIHTDIVEVEPPKVRRGIETRWWQGRWQKRLATGWKDA